MPGQAKSYFGVGGADFCRESLEMMLVSMGMIETKFGSTGVETSQNRGGIVSVEVPATDLLVPIHLSTCIGRSLSGSKKHPKTHLI